MKFRYTLVYVQDVAASLKFYEKAFGFKTRFLAEGGEYGELEVEGPVSLGFVGNKQAASNLPEGFLANNPKSRPGGFEIGLVVDDVQAAYAKAVKAGAHPAAQPTTKPWGQTVAYVRDRDGVLVELCSPMQH
ncbi:MAG: lactoylglutathione lyase [Thermoplasmata archaeon]|nr:lactoylglutathione lyase [Thermoplasmata archaeon]